MTIQEHPSIPARSAARSGQAGVLALRLLAILPALMTVGHHARAEPATTGQSTVPSQVIAAFDVLFAGPHAGARAVHAKGILCEGVFIPSPAAVTLSRAAHFSRPETNVLVRFSNFPGAPALADGDPRASPRGMAIKFLLPDGDTTDLVAHSYDGFPAATPEEFRDFLRALANPAQLDEFLAIHAAAKAFIAAPKPAPLSYATETYHGVSAFLFTNAAGTERAGRYHIAPVAGPAHLAPGDAVARPDDYLAQDMQDRLLQSPAEFRLSVQLAGDGDDIANGSVPWPPKRPSVEIGTVRLTRFVPDSAEPQQRLIFIPTNVVDGIMPGSDPMLLARTRAYRISAERRGAAE